MARASLLLVLTAALVGVAAAADVFTGDVFCCQGDPECIDEEVLVRYGNFTLTDDLVLSVEEFGLPPNLELTIMMNCANADGTVRETLEIVASTDESGMLEASGTPQSDGFTTLTSCNAPFVIIDGGDVHCVNAFPINGE